MQTTAALLLKSLHHYCRIYCSVASENTALEVAEITALQTSVNNFLETNHRKPSKFIPEERNMRSWWKHNKKLMNAGDLKPERVEMFKLLLELGDGKY